ncbi:universal stress protein [Natronobeatus ordinarius]|uniref:universal stress protein n=1 Tax=Natronobeatus ordinarius TaxID=2963433 RepID=UPI0020CC2034|nr:universal stress protein [Natronobeatus ordinarius]
MSDPPPWKVLLPVRALESEPLTPGLLELLAPIPAVVVGYHVSPEQTSPEQARSQFEARARPAVDEMVAAAIEAGGTVESRLVFTPSERKTIDRMTTEADCNVLLLPKPVDDVERLLVAVRGEVNADRLADFVATVAANGDLEITILHVARSDGGRDDGTRLTGAVASALVESGLDPAAVHESVVVDPSPLAKILAEAEAHDALIVGESGRSLRSFAFGPLSERIANRSVGPVFVVGGDRG